MRGAKRKNGINLGGNVFIQADPGVSSLVRVSYNDGWQLSDEEL
jgi:hypothetical protein